MFGDAGVVFEEVGRARLGLRVELCRCTRQSMYTEKDSRDIPSITKYKVSMSNWYATESRSDDPDACICPCSKHLHDSP